jgi:hypothetical protein
MARWRRPDGGRGSVFPPPLSETSSRELGEIGEHGPFFPVARSETSQRGPREKVPPAPNRADRLERLRDASKGAARVQRRAAPQGPEASPAGDGLGLTSVNPADRDLIANATAVAESIDTRHGFGAGIIRQLARRLAELAPAVDPLEPSDRCRHCGAPLVQPTTGRRRRYCSAAPCQQASRRGGKTREKATMGPGST